MAELTVELYGTRVGTLIGTWRGFEFVTDTAAVERFGIDSRRPTVDDPVPAGIRLREHDLVLYSRQRGLPAHRLIAERVDLYVAKQVADPGAVEGFERQMLGLPGHFRVPDLQRTGHVAAVGAQHTDDIL